MTDEVKPQRETWKSKIIKWSLFARKHTHTHTSSNKGKTLESKTQVNFQCAGRAAPHVFDKSSSRAGWGNDEVISVLWTGSNSLGRVCFLMASGLLTHSHTHFFFLCRVLRSEKLFTQYCSWYQDLIITKGSATCACLIFFKTPVTPRSSVPVSPKDSQAIKSYSRHASLTVPAVCAHSPGHCRSVINLAMTPSPCHSGRCTSCVSAWILKMSWAWLCLGL